MSDLEFDPSGWFNVKSNDADGLPLYDFYYCLITTTCISFTVQLLEALENVLLELCPNFLTNFRSDIEFGLSWSRRAKYDAATYVIYNSIIMLSMTFPQTGDRQKITMDEITSAKQMCMCACMESCKILVLFSVLLY